MINVFTVYINDEELLKNRIIREHYYGVKLLIYAIRTIYNIEIEEKDIQKDKNGKPFIKDEDIFF